ncbi:oligosaccharide flippase family protein [Altericista sp. CCNU0014]|uniref:oligosaccharide flippase family protein n=1 Tax=Altericista sp. CCNU0014 TaxID=3082949 RepID=UPI0038505706
MLLSAKVKEIVSGQVFRNMSWLGGAELVNRVFRLGTTLTLPRFFSKNEYGLMAIVYVALDFAFVFIHSGITAKIVQTDDESLQTVCDTSYWINWMACVSAFCIQCLAAYPISKFFGSMDLFWPLCFCALTYLLFPLFLIKSALIQRENRMNEIAIIHAAQSITASLTIVVLVILGMGIWAIALAMFFSTSIWMVVNFRETSWQAPKKITFKGWEEVVNFSKNVFGVELLNRLRSNLDYLIIGKFLSVEELGLYYFAFSAGSGITMNIVNTFVWALYPHLCSIRVERLRFKLEYFKNLKIIMLSISLAVVLQTSLSHFYVPILMGKEWIPAIPLLILICISVIPVSLKLVGSVLLNADNKPEFSLYFDVVYTIVFALSILSAVQFGIYWVAFAVLMCHLVMSILFSIFSSRKVFGSAVS